MSNTIKFIFAAALAAAGAYFRQLLVPFVVAVVVMAVDWLSGVAAATVEGQVSSRIGIIGILKKVGFSFIIVVGVVVDWVVQYAAKEIGFDASNMYYFGLLVTIWIIINELISILENVVRMGLPVPGFLKKAVERLKIHTEKKGDELAGGDSDEGNGNDS